MPTVHAWRAQRRAWCVSIEHKLGIKASPTAVLQFGDHGGAVGYLVGEENRGLEYMFMMMNAARFAVGMQGIAVADRAYQKAVGYARDRVQSRDLGGSPGPVAIIHHPDVKRMLLTMRAYTEGAPRTGLCGGRHVRCMAHHSPDPAVRKQQQAIYDYLVPVVKGFSTEMSIQVASLGVQVHGGMGFIEETGAAQHYRDARILTIYEGTTAIQANDIVGRKTVRDGGAVAKSPCAPRWPLTEDDLAAHSEVECAIMRHALRGAREALVQSINHIVAHAKTNPQGGVRRGRQLPATGRCGAVRLADGPRHDGGAGPHGRRPGLSTPPRWSRPASMPNAVLSTAIRPGPNVRRGRGRHHRPGTGGHVLSGLRSAPHARQARPRLGTPVFHSI
jgi:hypothetical protein